MVMNMEEPTAEIQSPQSFDTSWSVPGAPVRRSLANLPSAGGQRVLVLERRNHVAGNAYDRLDDAGVLVHQYGPHIFHTTNKRVFDYLSRFTAWNGYSHEVLPMSSVPTCRCLSTRFLAPGLRP